MKHPWPSVSHRSLARCGMHCGRNNSLLSFCMCLSLLRSSFEILLCHPPSSAFQRAMHVLRVFCIHLRFQLATSCLLPLVVCKAYGIDIASTFRFFFSARLVVLAMESCCKPLQVLGAYGSRFLGHWALYGESCSVVWGKLAFYIDVMFDAFSITTELV